MPACPGVADVYIDKRSRVWLVDINPFSTVTDSLLFDWSEDALVAPVPPQPTTTQDEEELPPDVFLRLHFQPASVRPTSTRDMTPAARPPDGVSGHPQARGGEGDHAGRAEQGHVGQASQMGVGRGGTRDRNFAFRFVPSDSHLAPDPMGRYRGPADLDMGTLAWGAEGGVDFERLLEACRAEGTNGD